MREGGSEVANEAWMVVIVRSRSTVDRVGGIWGVRIATDSIRDVDARRHGDQRRRRPVQGAHHQAPHG